jgi:hypothetical protein
MNNNEDKVLALYLLELIKKEIKKEIKNISFVNSYSGIVDNVGVGILDVKLAGSTTVLENLKDKTGVSVNVGDEVIVVVLKNNLSNAFVAWAK